MFLILCCADIYWPFVVGEWPPGDIWQELTPSTLHAAIDQAAAQSGIQINYTSGRPAGAGAGEQWAMIGYLDIGSRAQYKCKYIKHTAAREQGTLTKIVMGPQQYCCSHRTERRITDDPGPWLLTGGPLNSVKTLNFNKINTQKVNFRKSVLEMSKYWNCAAGSPVWSEPDQLPGGWLHHLL